MHCWPATYLVAPAEPVADFKAVKEALVKTYWNSNKEEKCLKILRFN
jgi:hypothetical protein